MASDRSSSPYSLGDAVVALTLGRALADHLRHVLDAPVPDEWQRLLAALGTAGEPPPAPPDAAPSGGPIDKGSG